MIYSFININGVTATLSNELEEFLAWLNRKYYKIPSIYMKYQDRRVKKKVKIINKIRL